MKTYFIFLLLILIPTFLFSQIYDDEIESGEIATYTKYRIKSRTEIIIVNLFHKLKNETEYEYKPNLFIRKGDVFSGFGFQQKFHYTDNFKIDSIISLNIDYSTTKSYPKFDKNRNFKAMGINIDSLILNDSFIITENSKHNEELVDTIEKYVSKFYPQKRLLVDIRELSHWLGVLTTKYYYNDEGLLIKKVERFDKKIDTPNQFKEAENETYFYYDENNFLIKIEYFHGNKLDDFGNILDVHFTPQNLKITKYRNNDKGLVSKAKSIEYQISKDTDKRKRIGNRLFKIKYRYKYYN